MEEEVLQQQLGYPRTEVAAHLSPALADEVQLEDRMQEQVDSEQLGPKCGQSRSDVVDADDQRHLGLRFHFRR